MRRILVVLFLLAASAGCWDSAQDRQAREATQKQLDAAEASAQQGVAEAFSRMSAGQPNRSVPGPGDSDSQTESHDSSEPDVSVSD